VLVVEPPDAVRLPAVLVARQALLVLVAVVVPRAASAPSS
jgi:hypothetical protein